MLTIYFDTSFYINLAQASQEEASELIDVLNRLQVRGVFSFDLAREMLTFAKNLRGDAKLVARIQGLQRGFLYLDDGSWDCLLLSGEKREKLAAEIIAQRKSMDLGHAFAIEAKKGMSVEEGIQMANANSEVVQKQGYSVDGDKVSLDFSVLASTLESVLADGTIVAEMPMALQECFETLIRLARNAGRVQGVEGANVNDQILQTYKQLEVEFAKAYPDVYESQNARVDVFRYDDRPKDVVLNRNRMSQLGRISNSLRDGGHIGRFMANADKVDFLQLDKVQYNRLMNTKRPSRLELNGLLSRCFWISSLSKLEEEISSLAVLEK